MPRRLATISVILAWVIGACGPEPAPATQATSTRPAGIAIDCGDVPAAPCNRIAGSDVTIAGAAATEITLRCSSEVCTDSDGKADVGLLTAVGLRYWIPEQWGTPAARSIPLPEASRVAPVCIGVPAPICADMDRSTTLPVGAPAVTRIVVACSTRCTPAAGEGQIQILFADGTRLQSSWGYGN